MNGKTTLRVFCGLVLCGIFYFLTLWLTGSGAGPDPVAAERLSKLAALKARDHQRLESYEWVDRENGVVRIPIERAMEIVIPQLNAEKPPGK